MTRWVWICLALAPAWAQMHDNQERTLQCDGQRGDRRLESFCEVREQTLPASARLEVDGGRNGGLSVKGWSRGDVLVRARVQAQAETEAGARALAGQVRIETPSGQVRASGPLSQGREYWSVTYEIFVPQQTDLSLKARNGGVKISDVRGQIEFETTNGGVGLTRLAGNVRGHTTNGGVKVELEGDHWDGQGLDARTTNGGVKFVVPDRYSAQFEAETVHGGLHVGFPAAVQKSANRRMSVQLGSGGATVRAVTTNGGVRIDRASGLI